MTLEQRMYRDPLKILIDEEQRTCKGCHHEQRFVAFGNPVMICTTKDEKNKRRNHGRRCKSYKEKA